MGSFRSAGLDCFRYHIIGIWLKVFRSFFKESLASLEAILGVLVCNPLYPHSGADARLARGLAALPRGSGGCTGKRGFSGEVTS